MEVRHGVLAANVAVKTTLSGNSNDVVVSNDSGAAEIYFTIDGSAPTVGGNGCFVLPAAVGQLRIPSPSQAGTVVQLIAAAPTRYSVAPVEPWGTSSFDPTGLAGLQFWLAADRIADQADGTPLAVWSDLSSYAAGRLASQATPANQPLYRTNMINGKPVVRFDNVDDVMTATIPTLTQPNTVFVVGRLYALVAANRYFFDGGAGTRHAVYSSTSNSWRMYAGTTLTGPDNVANLNPHVFCSQFNTTSSLMRVDGVQIAAGNAGSNNLGPTITLGKDPTSASYLPGDLAEVVLYNRALSGAEILQVEQHLGAKYAITLG